MATFGEVSKFVSRWLSQIPEPLVLELVNQAREQIYAEREWGFLHASGYIRIPALINTSTVAVTKYSKSVIVSADVKTILDAIGVDDIPVIGRQFLVKGSKTNKIYTIAGWDSATSTLTLDDIYLYDTNAAAKYEIFKAYYNPPQFLKPDGSLVYDFARFDSVIDTVNNWKFHINVSQSILGARDNSRLVSGNPYVISSLGEDSAGNPLFELYPHPKQKTEQVIEVEYLRKGYNLTEEDNLPFPISKQLLIARVKASAYEWAEVNKGKHPELQKISWSNLIAYLNSGARDSYDSLLAKAIQEDASRYPSAIVSEINDYEFYGDDLLVQNGVTGMNETLITPDSVMRIRF